MIDRQKIQYLSERVNDHTRTLNRIGQDYQWEFEDYLKDLEELKKESDKLDGYDPVEVDKFKRGIFYSTLTNALKEATRKAGFQRVVNSYLTKSRHKLSVNLPFDYEFPEETTHKIKGIDVLSEVQVSKKLREQRNEVAETILKFVTRARISNEIKVKCYSVQGYPMYHYYKSKKAALEGIEVLKRQDVISIHMCLHDYVLNCQPSERDNIYFKVWECTDEELLNLKALYDL